MNDESSSEKPGLPSKADTESGNSRIQTIDLIVATTCVAIFFTISRLALRSQPLFQNMQSISSVYFVLYGISYGFGLTFLPVFLINVIRRGNSANDRRTWNLQPGHLIGTYFWIYYGGYYFQFLLMAFANNDTGEFYTMVAAMFRILADLSCVLLLVYALFRFELRWRICTWLWLAVTLITLTINLSYFAFYFDWIREGFLGVLSWIGFAISIGSFVAILGSLIAMIGDWRNGVHRDWLHYYGFLVALIFCFPFLFNKIVTIF
ncbi:MAG: hypothetical protein AAFN77_14005 [Planctomycetota bacterium]